MQISAISSHLCNSKCKQHTVKKFWNDCFADLLRPFVTQNEENQRIVGTGKVVGDPLG